MGLDLDLQAGFDLWALSEVIDEAPHLTIRGESLTGWDALERARQLRSVNVIAEPPIPVHLDALPLLEYAFANSANAAYVASSPNLRELRATLESWPGSLVVGERVQRIEIWESKRLTELPPMKDPTSLVELDLRYTRSFDMSSLRGAINLRKLSLGLCKRVLHCEVLLELPRLDEVFMGGVREMVGWQALRELKVSKFTMPNQRVAVGVEQLTRPTKVGQTSGLA